jgi:hypothetical protein
MSQRQWIVVIGVWIMVFLFLGFPSSWQKILALLTGLILVVFAYRIRFKEAVKPADTFTDSTPGTLNPTTPTDAA